MSVTNATPLTRPNPPAMSTDPGTAAPGQSAPSRSQPASKAAVGALQSQLGMRRRQWDGIVGPDTVKALNTALHRIDHKQAIILGVRDMDAAHVEAAKQALRHPGQPLGASLKSGARLAQQPKPQERSQPAPVAPAPADGAHTNAKPADGVPASTSAAAAPGEASGVVVKKVDGLSESALATYRKDFAKFNPKKGDDVEGAKRLLAAGNGTPFDSKTPLDQQIRSVQERPGSGLKPTGSLDFDTYVALREARKARGSDAPGATKYDAQFAVVAEKEMARMRAAGVPESVIAQFPGLMQGVAYQETRAGALNMKPNSAGASGVMQMTPDSAGDFADRNAEQLAKHFHDAYGLGDGSPNKAFYIKKRGETKSDSELRDKDDRLTGVSPNIAMGGVELANWLIEGHQGGAAVRAKLRAYDRALSPPAGAALSDKAIVTYALRAYNGGYGSGYGNNRQNRNYAPGVYAWMNRVAFEGGTLNVDAPRPPVVATR